jgi:hypothetical protein
MPELPKLKEIIGKRVQIQAIKECGSARLLNGLKGTVIGRHPIAAEWVKLQLDRNSVTSHREWSVPAERLVLC